MFNGKMKALTFSYDDGVTQDIRLIELFNKYGMKGTFNLNSARLGQPGDYIKNGKRILHNQNKPEDIKYIYEGHEVAAHTLDHPRLTIIESDAEVTRQVEEDRLRLSELVGYEVVGLAYPCGGVNYDSRVSNLVRETTGIKYARSTISSFDFALQDNLYEFSPSVDQHNQFDEMVALGEKFLSLKTDEPAIFYVWAHSYELDIRDDWGRFEEFLQMMSGKDDICYCTNSEALLAGR